MSVCLSQSEADLDGMRLMCDCRSQFCTRGLLLDYEKVPSVEMPKRFSVSTCCCFGNKVHSFDLDSPYRTEPAPLFLVK